MENNNSKEINFIQFLLSKSKKNCVRCVDCKILFPNAHLICFKVFKKDNILYWENKYTVGCSQKDFNGESWCNDCLTIYNNEIHCAQCANISYGVPNLSDTTRKWVWVDGSISSISELFIEGDSNWNIVDLSK